MGIVGTLIMLDGITVPLRARAMTTIPVHHLLHAGMALGAGLLAMAMASRLPRRNGETTYWVIAAVLAPAAGLFLMWPSAYAYLMDHRWMHVLDHLGIALCSVLAIFAAQAYVRGLGWPMVALLVMMNAGAASGFGVSPGASTLCSPQASVQSPGLDSTAPGDPGIAGSGAAAVQNVPLHVAGQRLSQSLGCVACHSADGAKGIGPSWKNLAGYPQQLADGRSKIADYPFLRNAILYPERLQLRGFPAGTMPTSFREMLSGPQHADERDLNALIWYINTLSDRGSAATQPPVPDTSPK